MTVPLRLALPLIVVTGLIGWTVGGFVAVRYAAFNWTATSIAHDTKGDRP